MSVNAACANFRPPPPPIPAEHAGTPPTEVWSVRAGRGISDPVAVSDTRAWVAGTDRQVKAIALDDAGQVWAERLPGAAVGGVLLRDSVVYLATHRPQGRVLAFDAATGRRLWQSSAGEATTALGTAGDLVATVNRRGELVALDRRTGRPRWTRKVGLSRVAPADARDAFLVSTQDSLLRVETSAGRTTHRRASLGPVLAGWRRLGSHLVAPTGDSLVVAIDPADLRPVWQVKVDAPVMGDLGIRGDTIWAVTRIGTLYRVVAGGTAVPVASLATPVTTGVALVGELLVVGAADGTLRALTRDGREVWRLALSWNITVDPVAIADGFIALGGDGDLHRYRR